VTAIDVAVDGDETELARTTSSDLEQTRTEEVDRIAVPEIYLHDLPTAGHPCPHAPKRRDRRPAIEDADQCSTTLFVSDRAMSCAGGRRVYEH
jgi:hypothetical protein